MRGKDRDGGRPGVARIRLRRTGAGHGDAGEVHTVAVEDVDRDVGGRGGPIEDVDLGLGVAPGILEGDRRADPDVRRTGRGRPGGALRSRGPRGSRGAGDVPLHARLVGVARVGCADEAEVAVAGVDAGGEDAGVGRERRGGQDQQGQHERRDTGGADTTDEGCSHASVPCARGGGPRHERRIGKGRRTVATAPGGSQGAGPAPLDSRRLVQ